MARRAGQAAPPAGRAADGKPDFSGIWQALNEANWDLQAHEARPAAVMQQGVYPYAYAQVPAAPVLAGRYLTVGMDVPQGTSALRNSTRSVGLWNARKGDLLFFNQSGKKYSHVGIYIGDDQFVHAPSTGGFVRKDSITDAYWKKHYLDTRRFL